MVFSLNTIFDTILNDFPQRPLDIHTIVSNFNKKKICIYCQAVWIKNFYFLFHFKHIFWCHPGCFNKKNSPIVYHPKRCTAYSNQSFPDLELFPHLFSSFPTTTEYFLNHCNIAFAFGPQEFADFVFSVPIYTYTAFRLISTRKCNARPIGRYNNNNTHLKGVVVFRVHYTE